MKELQDESRQLVAELEKRSFSEEEALITMIRLERDFCQVHIEVVAQFTDPRMLKLFESLAGDDESHRQTLESYLARVASGG